MIEIRDVEKNYRMGDNIVHALRGVSLKIDDGDFVAIMGPSGSGKSTLAHILGLLDVPNSGSYVLNGREISNYSEDELAILRREEIGFVFQQFNLLPRMNAEENVALPLFYSKKSEFVGRAKELLNRVGIGARSSHRPNELSGGQQQRVAIARALINRPRVILADEPTGNLDSVSEKEIIQTLKDLNAEGITVIIVTHEEAIGAQARRLIRMHDGKVASDERRDEMPEISSVGKSEKKIPNRTLNDSIVRELIEHFRGGYRTLIANKIRTALSMLGILIGVAAVVAMLALGSGAQKTIESQLSSLGSNLLVLSVGAVKVGGVYQEAGASTRLTAEDAVLLRSSIPELREVTASVSGRGQVVFTNKNWNTQIQGSLPEYEVMKNATPQLGRFFTAEENERRALVAVLGIAVVRELFGGKNPIGETIKINRINFTVIGVLPEKGGSGWRNQDDVIVVPLATAMRRLLGKNYVDSIDLEVAESSKIAATQEKILNFMYRHKRIPEEQREDAYQIFNMADIQAAMTESTKTMSMLLSAIAAISLLVGGIGIMNIMLVSVTERTKEIGLRKAIGARRRDILLQFLAESVLVSVIGGLAGLGLAWLITFGIAAITKWNVSITLSSVMLSFFFSATIGMVFGIYPARKASFLHPIDALRFE